MGTKQTDEICPKCGRVSKSYKFFVRRDYWVCRRCVKDIVARG